MGGLWDSHHPAAIRFLRWNLHSGAYDRKIRMDSVARNSYTALT